MNLRTAMLSTLATLGAATLPTVAGAIPIATTSVDWSNASGGSNISYDLTNGDYVDVRWGVPHEGTGNGQRSGLGFDPANPPAIDQPANTPFVLGMLRHYNNPINAGTAASTVDLTLLTTITGGVPVQQDFKFRFAIDETPNENPCAYTSTTPCADRITFQNLDLTSSFVYSGVSYTLQLIGFGESSSSLTNRFISQEGGTRSAPLWARFTATSVPTQVPEPGTLSLLALGLLLTGAAARRRRNA